LAADRVNDAPECTCAENARWKGILEVTTDEKDVVSAVGVALAERVGKERYETWFGCHTRLRFDGASLQVGVPNQFFQDWLRSHFRRDVESACREVIPGECQVSFEIVKDAAPTELPPEMSGKESLTKPANGSAALLPFAPTRAAATGNRRQWATLGTYVIGKSNRLAHATAMTIQERPGEVSPAILHGPTGVGKTHLLEGICSAARGTRNALYLTAEQFTTQFLEALRGSGLPNFRHKCRSADVLLIDDIQFFTGKRATLVELLHTVDYFTRERKQLVLTADRPLEDLQGLGADLLARLQGGMPCRIEAPDEEVRLGIVRQRAAVMGLKAGDDVWRFIAQQFTSQARELFGALNLLQAESRAHRATITLEFAQEALSDLVRQSARPIRLADIEKAVCEVFALQADSLQSESKTQAVSQPRMLAMFLARKLTRAALSEIGQHFGGRKHTTVISAHKKMGKLMAQKKSIRLHDRDCPVEEALRKVEAAIKTG
jgi:chromosomal replication initiator protein